MNFNVGAGSRCLICFEGMDSNTSFGQYLVECKEKKCTLPPEIHVFINASYFDRNNHVRMFGENTEDSPRVYGFVQREDIENMWSGRSPYGCKIAFKDRKSTTMYIAEHDLGMVGVNDFDMTFDEAAMINPVGTIKRLHNEGAQRKHCWIHTEHEKSLIGNSRKKCMGCHAVYGVDGIHSTTSAPQEITTDYVDRLCSRFARFIVRNEIPQAIVFMDSISDHVFNDDHGPWVQENSLKYLIDIVISEGRMAMYDYLYRRFPTRMRAETQHTFECLSSCSTTLEVFAHVVNAGFDINALNHNPISAMICTHHYQSKNCSNVPELLRELLQKVRILLNVGIDPRRTYRARESSAFDMMCLYYTYFIRHCGYGEDIFDLLFEYSKSKRNARRFDPNSVFDFNMFISHIQTMENPILLLKYLRDKQGAAVDYTTNTQSNILFYLCDVECAQYVCSTGANKFQTNTDGQNIVTFILEKLIEDHTTYSNGNVLEYLKFFMSCGVNAYNKVPTQRLVHQLLLKYENVPQTIPRKWRDIQIHEFFRQYYANDRSAFTGEP